MSHSQTPCPICKKSNRTDVLLRHIQNNHEPIDYMNDKQRQYAFNQEVPIVYKKTDGVIEFAYCAVCKDGRHNKCKGGKEELDGWIDAHSISDCCERFYEVKTAFGETPADSETSSVSTVSGGSVGNTVDMRVDRAVKAERAARADKAAKYPIEQFRKEYMDLQRKVAKEIHKSVYTTEECTGRCSGLGTYCGYTPSLSMYTKKQVDGMYDIWVTDRMARAASAATMKKREKAKHM